MSLNWDTRKIKNGDDVCFVQKEDGRYLNPVTNSLIWATMSVGIPTITEKNWVEFAERMNMMEKVRGAFLITTDDDGKHIDRPITTEEIKAHVGLSTNASSIATQTFLKNMMSSCKDSVSYDIREMGKKENK